MRRDSIRHSPAQPVQPHHMELANVEEPANFASRQNSNQQRHQIGIIDELRGDAEVVSDKVLHPAASLFGKLIDDSLDSTVSTSPVSTIQSPTNDEEQWGYEPPAASVWLIYFVSLSMR